VVLNEMPLRIHSLFLKTLEVSKTVTRPRLTATTIKNPVYGIALIAIVRSPLYFVAYPLLLVFCVCPVFLFFRL
jgi:hypothetical protein